MKKIDAHIHAHNTTPSPEGLLKKLAEANISAACVYSNNPFIPNKENGDIFSTGTSFEERLEEVLGWCKGYEDKIFPVLWVHPYEENIFENIKIAAERGIVAFKMICNDFYVYEERSLAVLREIAKLGKPVIFHSGILWDGGVSSTYNRPLNWEALIEIEGLKFSLAHCSWPWIDECIALYGKFMNSLTKRNTAEMFFDTTPGTPAIYRRELLEKLYTVGYDIGHNILFGTDSSAENYNSGWANEWIDRDTEILKDLGVSQKNLDLYFNENILRFLGKTSDSLEKICPTEDDSTRWTPEEPELKDTVKKWYYKLGFPTDMDAEFENALETIKLSDAVNIDNYDLSEKNGKKNLLYYLYFCEALSKKYKEKGISEEILLDTLHDIVVWTETWSAVKGELYLGELTWLKRHLSMRLFKLGRLQFCMADSEFAIPEKGLEKDAPVVEVHIPEGEPLSIDACRESIDLAREFFAKYLPEYDYSLFTCHSWMLDSSLSEFLSSESNILKFAKLFKIVSEDPSDAIFGYLFSWGTKRRHLKYRVANSSFAASVKKAAMSGKVFYETLGYICK